MNNKTEKINKKKEGFSINFQLQGKCNKFPYNIFLIIHWTCSDSFLLIVFFCFILAVEFNVNIEKKKIVTQSTPPSQMIFKFFCFDEKCFYGF